MLKSSLLLPHTFSYDILNIPLITFTFKYKFGNVQRLDACYAKYMLYLPHINTKNELVICPENMAPFSQLILTRRTQQFRHNSTRHSISTTASKSITFRQPLLSKWDEGKQTKNTPQLIPFRYIFDVSLTRVTCGRTYASLNFALVFTAL